MTRQLLLTLLRLVVFAGSTSAAVGQLDERSAPPSIPAISAVMTSFVDQGVISGAVTLVARDGRIVHLNAVGMADLESQRAMRNGTLFSIASMTKPIVATGLMILYDEGKIRLDDKVSKYLPAFAHTALKGGERQGREITIHDLLTHTSGLGGSQVEPGSLAQIADALATRPLDFQPGTRWQYSPGLNVVGRIIEVVSGQPLQDFLQARLLTPLALKNTTFFPDAQQTRRMATLYQPGDEPGALKPDENFIVNPAKYQAPNPSGGLVSNARDLYRFYQMVLDGGTFHGARIVSSDTVQQMTSLQTGELTTGFTPGNGWGLGWCVVRQPQGVSEMLSPGTFGHGGAFGTQGWVDRQTRTIYVLLIQRTKLPNSDDSEIRKAFQRAAQG